MPKPWIDFVDYSLHQNKNWTIITCLCPGVTSFHVGYKLGAKIAAGISLILFFIGLICLFVQIASTEKSENDGQKLLADENAMVSKQKKVNVLSVGKQAVAAVVKPNQEKLKIQNLLVQKKDLSKRLFKIGISNIPDGLNSI